VFPSRRLASHALVLAALFASGCSSNDASPSSEVRIDEPIESAKARVKFKEQGRFVRDLAASLELRRDEVCKELGLFDCYEDAHRIVLGGVEPYRRGIRDPLPVAPVTAPIAVDRVALSACATRVDRDFDNPSEAVMFGELATIGPTDELLEQTAHTIYERLLRRAATDDEVDSLVAFHSEARDTLDASDDDPTREWAVASCFAVATTMEGLFY